MGRWCTTFIEVKERGKWRCIAEFNMYRCFLLEQHCEKYVKYDSPELDNDFSYENYCSPACDSIGILTHEELTEALKEIDGGAIPVIECIHASVCRLRSLEVEYRILLIP